MGHLSEVVMYMVDARFNDGYVGSESSDNEQAGDNPDTGGANYDGNLGPDEFSNNQEGVAGHGEGLNGVQSDLDVGNGWGYPVTSNSRHQVDLGNREIANNDLDELVDDGVNRDYFADDEDDENDENDAESDEGDEEDDDYGYDEYEDYVECDEEEEEEEDEDSFDSDEMYADDRSVHISNDNKRKAYNLLLRYAHSLDGHKVKKPFPCQFDANGNIPNNDFGFQFNFYKDDLSPHVGNYLMGPLNGFINESNFDPSASQRNRDFSKLTIPTHRLDTDSLYIPRKIRGQKLPHMMVLPSGYYCDIYLENTHYSRSFLEPAEQITLGNGTKMKLYTILGGFFFKYDLTFFIPTGHLVTFTEPQPLHLMARYRASILMHRGTKIKENKAGNKKAPLPEDQILMTVFPQSQYQFEVSKN